MQTKLFFMCFYVWPRKVGSMHKAQLRIPTQEHSFLCLRAISPGGPPKKGLIRNIHIFPLFLSLKFRGLKLRFLALNEGPGGFRKVREAGRNHFHLSWYLAVPGVTSYDQNTSKEEKQLQQLVFIGYVFLKQPGLNAMLASWDLNIWISCRKLRI